MRARFKGFDATKIEKVRTLAELKCKYAATRLYANWPAPGSEDTELGVSMEPEVDHGETEVYPGV
jgi:hypothetical protein